MKKTTLTNKITAIALALMLIIGLVPVSATEPEGSIPEVIYLDIAGSDLANENACVHILDNQYVSVSDFMTLVDGTVYSYTLPEGAVTVSFTNPTGSISAMNLTIPTDGTNLYTFATGEWSTYVEPPEFRYSLTIEQGAGGTLIADKYGHNGGGRGDTVLLTIVPDEGYEFVKAEVWSGERMDGFINQSYFDENGNAYWAPPNCDTILKNVVFRPSVVAWNDTDNNGVIDEGETTYKYIKDALMAGGEVKLAADYNAYDEGYFALSGTEEAPINTTLDLFGHTLSTNDNYLIDVYEHFSITITDTSDSQTGALVTTANSLMFCNTFTSAITVNGGDFEATETVIGMAAGNVTITGGRLLGTLYGRLENCTVTGGSFSDDPSNVLGDGYYAKLNPETGLYDVGLAPYSVTVEYGETDTSLISVSPDKNRHLGLGDTASFTFSFSDNCIFISAEIWAGGAHLTTLTADDLDDNGTYTLDVPDADVVVKNILVERFYEPRITGISINDDSPAYNSYSGEFVITDETPLVITVTGEHLQNLDFEAAYGDKARVVLVTNVGDRAAGSIGTYEFVGDTVVITVTADEIEEFINSYPNGNITHVAYENADSDYYEDDIVVRIEFKKSTVSAVDIENGKIDISNFNADAGEEILLSPNADEGYYFDLSTLTATDENGDPIELVDYNGYGEYFYFIMPEGDVTVSCSTKEYIPLDVTVLNGEDELPLDGTGAVNIGDTITVNVITGTEPLKIEMGIKGRNINLILSSDALSYTLTADHYYDAVHELLSAIDRGAYDRTFFVRITDAAGIIKQYLFELPDYDSLLPLPERDYKITLKDAENGSLYVGVTSADEGDYVGVELVGVAGYVPTAVTVTDADGNPIGANVSPNYCYFYMPASDVTVSAEFVFSDEPRVTGISFYESSPTYDPATGTFTVTPSHPLIITIEGINMHELGNDLPYLVISGDLEAFYTAGYGNVNDDGTQATHIWMYDNHFLYEYEKIWIGYSDDGRYVNADHMIELNLKLVSEDPTLYYVTANDTENGIYELSKKSAVAGVSVLIYTLPDVGYEVDTVTVSTTDGRSVDVVDGAFVMPDADVTVTVTFKEEPNSVDPNPGDNDPSDNDPSDSEPADSDPSDSEPADSEPADSEPADSEPSDSEPADSEPADSEPADSEPADNEPSDSEPADTDSVDTDPIDSETVEKAPVDTDPKGTESDTESDDDGSRESKWIITGSIVIVAVVILVGAVFIFKKKFI